MNVDIEGFESFQTVMFVHVGIVVTLSVWKFVEDILD